MNTGCRRSTGGTQLTHQESFPIMHVHRSAVTVLAAAVLVGGWIAVGIGQRLPPTPGVLEGPYTGRGQAIYPAFEGWGPLKDGSNAILIGYYNRNKDQELDIPIGPNNHFEGTADMGQPTHFLTGRQYGVFAIKLPKDFGTNRLTWTLVANGQTAKVQFWVNPPYWVDFFLMPAQGNTPPVFKWTQDGTEMTGPPIAATLNLDGKVNEAVPLSIWAKDAPPTPDYDPQRRGSSSPAGLAGGRAAAGRAGAAGRGGAAAGAAAAGRGRGRGGRRPDITVQWTKYRGPGWVTLDDTELDITNNGDPKLWTNVNTEAWFDTPGEYWLRAQINDTSGDGGGGEQCCWTNALVKVNVAK